MSLLTSLLGSINGGGSSSLNVGTVASGSTVVEHGDGYTHTSIITVNTTLPAIAGGAALAIGKLLYTLPAGACVVSFPYISLGITQTQGNINADTPDVGLGTTIASGAVATLSGTAAFENIMTGQTAANCTGTPTVNTSIVHTQIAVGDDHGIYFNVADTWAASGDAAALLTGTVVLQWQFIN